MIQTIYASQLTHYVDSPVEAVMYLVIPDDRVTPCAYLHTRQRVAMDIIVLQYTTPTSKEVYTSLHPTMNFVVLESRIAFTCDPHTCVRVGVYLVVNELPSTLYREMMTVKMVQYVICD